MEPPERPKPHCPEGQRDDNERQEALAGLPAIALRKEEAARFLDALARPCDRRVTRLTDLRRRA